MISQKLSYDRPVDFLKKWFLHHLKRHRKFHLERRLSVHQLHGAVQKFSHIVNAAPDLRHTAVHAAKSVNSLHGRADRIFGREDRISRCLCELSKEGRVHRSVRDHIRAVAGSSRHEECCDIRHHRRCAVACFPGKPVDVLHRDPEMVQPLSCDLLTGALFHRFLHMISRDIGEQAVYPDANLILFLVFKLSLTVDRPA